MYNQALRYRRIITNNSLLGEHLKKLKENLIRRGYKLSDINKQFNKLRGLTQKDLLYRTKTMSVKITHYPLSSHTMKQVQT